MRRAALLLLCLCLPLVCAQDYGSGIPMVWLQPAAGGGGPTLLGACEFMDVTTGVTSKTYDYSADSEGADADGGSCIDPVDGDFVVVLVALDGHNATAMETISVTDDASGDYFTPHWREGAPSIATGSVSAAVFSLQYMDGNGATTFTVAWPGGDNELANVVVLVFDNGAAMDTLDFSPPVTQDSGTAPEPPALTGNSGWAIAFSAVDGGSGAEVTCDGTQTTLANIDDGAGSAGLGVCYSLTDYALDAITVANRESVTYAFEVVDTSVYTKPLPQYRVTFEGGTTTNCTNEGSDTTGDTSSSIIDCDDSTTLTASQGSQFMLDPTEADTSDSVSFQDKVFPVVNGVLTDEFWLTFDLYVHTEAGSEFGQHLNFRSSSDTNIPMNFTITHNVTNDALRVLCNGTNTQVNNTYATGEWQTIKLHIDVGDATMDLYCDGSGSACNGLTTIATGGSCDGTDILFTYPSGFSYAIRTRAYQFGLDDFRWYWSDPGSDL